MNSQYILTYFIRLASIIEKCKQNRVNFPEGKNFFPLIFPDFRLYFQGQYD